LLGRFIAVKKTLFALNCVQNRLCCNQAGHSSNFHNAPKTHRIFCAYLKYPNPVGGNYIAMKLFSEPPRSIA
jgi:hypothetical protein